MKSVLPGSSVGVFGGGQLGRMFALAAREMGYRIVVFTPESGSPAGQIADREIVAPYNDQTAVETFARGVSAITLEFENIPVSTAEAAAAITPLRPSPSVLHTTQHRVREKRFLAENGFPVVDFAVVRSLDELQSAIGNIGCPAVLKSASMGYDGKGQYRIATPADAAAAWEAVAHYESVLESFVSFEKELSVVCVRAADGRFRHWGVMENAHRNHILDTSFSPASVEPGVAKSATELARSIAEALGVVGILCIELFLLPGGTLVVNELAPRPHNSGHLTIEAATTSQFEQQVRAVCGLPLGATDLRPSAMANLLGEVWKEGEPDWRAALELGVKLHLYGKDEPRRGRKMGHLTATAATADEALRLVTSARERLVTRGQGRG